LILDGVRLGSHARGYALVQVQEIDGHGESRVATAGDEDLDRHGRSHC